MDTGAGYYWRQRDGTEEVSYRGDEKGLRGQGAYRGQETNH